MKNWEFMDERLLKAKLTVKGYEVAVIGIYFTTDSASDVVQAEHLEKLMECLAR